MAKRQDVHLTIRVGDLRLNQQQHAKSKLVFQESDEQMADSLLDDSCHDLRDSGPELKGVAEQYARIFYRIREGEDKAFNGRWKAAFWVA
jgi:hypothetical protein